MMHSWSFLRTQRAVRLALARLFTHCCHFWSFGMSVRPANIDIHVGMSLALGFDCMSSRLWTVFFSLAFLIRTV